MSKHTPGPVVVFVLNGIAKAVSPGGREGDICLFDDGCVNVNANADLICEAFNVATETGLTPRQLAEQRAELLNIAESLSVLLHDCESAGLQIPETVDEKWGNLSERLYAIAKAEGRP